MVYICVMGTVQCLQLILITNYSKKADVRVDSEGTDMTSSRLNSHLEQLMSSYRHSAMHSNRDSLFNQENRQPNTSITMSEFEDPDFIEDEDEEKDRKFHEIMATSMSIDNQIICQFARVKSDSIYTICAN